MTIFAELMSLLRGSGMCVQLNISDVQVRSDSELVVEAKRFTKHTLEYQDLVEENHNNYL